jgi:hypothetical protein
VKEVDQKERWMRATGIAALLLFLLGCGAGPDVISEGASVEDPYDGPLHLRVAAPDHPDPLVRAGAAGRAIECSGQPYAGSTGHNWGVASGLATPEEALEAFVDDDGGLVPRGGYRLERETKNRVLFSYDVSGETKVAVIVAENTEGAGWTMETFAACDPAELPDAVTDELGIDVWVNAKDERVPTRTIQSSRGPEHCDWDSAIFLSLGDDIFVKDTQGVLPHELLSGPFVPDIALPKDARDTGYMLDGQRLWVGADRSSAFIVTEQAVERWPVATASVGCG